MICRFQIRHHLPEFIHNKIIQIHERDIKKTSMKVAIYQESLGNPNVHGNMVGDQRQWVVQLYLIEKFQLKKLCI